MAPSMEEEESQATSSVLQEIDLGWHQLFIYRDQSIELLASKEVASLAGITLRLKRDETYRLLISLQEEFASNDKEKPPGREMD